jgi:hypothetical protein
VLHLPFRFLLSRLGVSSSSSRHRLASVALSPFFSMLVPLGVVRAPRGHAKQREKQL